MQTTLAALRAMPTTLDKLSSLIKKWSLVVVLCYACGRSRLTRYNLGNCRVLERFFVGGDPDRKAGTTD